MKNFDLDFDLDLDLDLDLDIKNRDKTFLFKETYSKMFLKKLKIEKVKNIVIDLPLKNEIINIITEGEFNSISIILAIIEMTPGQVQFFASCLGINYFSFQKLLDYYNDKKILNINLICDKDIMNIRHDGVKELILSTAKKINLKFSFVRNHTKITLITNGIDYYVITSSANYSTNVQFEQYLFFNSIKAYNFYLDWFNYHLNKPKLNKT